MDLENSINVKNLSLILPRIIYEPDQFPGAIFKTSQEFAHFYQIASDEYKKGNNVNKYQECLSLCSKNTIFDEYIEVQVELPRFHFSGETEYDLIDILIKYYFDCEKSLVDTARSNEKL